MIAPVESAPTETPSPIDELKDTPIETPIEAPVEEPVEEPKERTTPMINPVPNYPAYIVDQCGTIWGIPATLEGCTQKEIIHLSTIATEDEPAVEIPSSEIQLFTLAGYIYVRRNRNADSGPVIDYYRQAIGSTIVEVVDTIPPMPDERRVTLDSSEWLIETAIINKSERTDIYNRHELRGYDRGAKGYGPIVRDMVTAFVILDNGILWMSTSGAEYCPNNRLSADQIAEPGRLWR